MATPTDLFVYAHIGDLHVTEADADNYRDLRRIVADIDRLGDAVSFVFVPGDNADNGLPEQYALVADALAQCSRPVHVITGDHDMEQGSLANFHATLGARRLPYAETIAGVRCLFLDLCGGGSGGQDFRIGAAQREWLRDEIASAERDGARCAVFMHTYPDDLKGPGETQALNAILASPAVLLVDMGHTHYNELANDGRTIFAATRSTGQIEEGPVGYSLVAIDRRSVSWRFREPGTDGPTVLITAPADRRLATDGEDQDHLASARCEVRVLVLGDVPIASCVCRVDGAEPLPMSEVAPRRYTLVIDTPPEGATLTVSATDDTGRQGSETIELARPVHLARERHADGSDRDAVDAWPERGILGTQLGPNRNGREW